jgi:hypothetical protein
MENNYFINLNKVNIADKTETKGRLKYLSWTYAWEQLKRIHPNANYAIIKNNKGWLYHTDERTAWVEVSVTVDEITHTEYLPVMNNRNQSISLDKITSMDANKAIQRAITKAIARHGIGLCLYAGEDISDDARLDAVNDIPQEAYNAQGIANTVKYINTVEALKIYLQETKTKYPEHNQEIIDICTARSEELKKEEANND